jgi:hypothetical protein
MVSKIYEAEKKFQNFDINDIKNKTNEFKKSFN